MQLKIAVDEIRNSLKAPHLWALLGWFDIRQRYRRSVLGPLWLTLSMGIMIGSLGILWATLFKTDIHEFLPYFAVGNVLWVYFSGQVTESCTGFTQFEHILRQIKIPLPTYLLRLLTRNLIVLGHNAVIVFIVVTFFGKGWSWVALLAIPGLIVVSVAALFLSIIIAILCTRFRDMPPIVQNVTMVAFYLTPIIWQERTLGGRYSWVVTYNPLAHLIDIVRLPILNTYPSSQSWYMAIGFALICTAIALPLLARFRSRIAYWL
jgi:ABC-type polysaccharide/polyol phosphate export permease